MRCALAPAVAVILSAGWLSASQATEPAFKAPKKMEIDPEAKIGEPVFKEDKKVWSYTVSSPYLNGENEVEVLLPDSFDKKKKYRVLYVLPVEKGIGGHFGDGLQEMRKADVQNRHDLICVTMAFDGIPWYGAHATDPKIRQEEYILKVVVPLVESRYPTLGTPEGRLLIGFSKSGCGAFSLILRNPDVFGYACSWDAPLMVDWPGGWGIKEHFGTQENFEKYHVSKLFETRAPFFKDRPRLVLLGEFLFGPGGRFPDKRGHTVLAHEKMTALGIQHVFRDDLHVHHQWTSDRGVDQGWEKPAVEALISIVAPNAPAAPAPPKLHP